MTNIAPPGPALGYFIVPLAACLILFAGLAFERHRLMALRWPRRQGFFQMQKRLQRYFSASGWEVRTGGLAGIDRLIMRRACSGECVIKPCPLEPDTSARAIKDFAELNTFAPGKKHIRIMVVSGEVSPHLSAEAYSRGVFVLYYRNLGALAALYPASPADVEACLRRIVEQGRPDIVSPARLYTEAAENAPPDQAPQEESAIVLASPPPTLIEPPATEPAAALSVPAVQADATQVKQVLEHARADLKSRNPASAADAFRAVLAHTPAHVGALSGLAAALNQLGLTAEAVEAVRKAVAIAPRNAGLLVQFAQLLNKAGKTAEATGAFEMAVSIDPTIAVAQAPLNAALKRQSSDEAAIAALRAGIDAAPRNAQLHVDLGHLLNSRPERAEAAEAAFRAALALDPKHAGALAALGNCLARQGDFHGAVTQLRLATTQAPKNAGFHLRLGQLLEEIHDIAAAFSAFAEALQLDPQNAAARAGLRRSRDPNGLFALFERLLGPDPTGHDLEKLSVELDVAQAQLSLLLDFARAPQESELAAIAPTPIEQALLHATLVAQQRQEFVRTQGAPAPLQRLGVAEPELDGLAETGSHEIWTPARWLNAFVMRRTPPCRRAAVVATMRDEGLYVLEWVAHYRVIGFDSIFIYSNDNLDGSEDLLRALAEHGIITYIDNRMDARLSHNPQQKAYAHAQHLLPELWEHEWALVVDGDELLVPSEAYGFQIGALIDDALSRHPDRAPSAICFNWLWYFSGHAYAYAPGPLLRRFPHGAGRRGMKSLVRLRDITSLQRIHYPDITPDGFLIRADFSRLDWSLRQKKLDPVFDSAWLAHYWNKSFEEFSIKKARGDAACDRDPMWKRDFELFFTTNARQTPQNHRPAPEALIKAVEAEMKNLLALPGIAQHMAIIEATRLTLLERFDRDGGLASIYESVKAATLGRSANV